MRRRGPATRGGQRYEYRHRAPNARRQARSAVLDTLLHASRQFSFWAVDRAIRYLFFNNTHRMMMQRFWGKTPQHGEKVLEQVKDATYREHARGLYQRALAGETFLIETGVAEPSGVQRVFQYVFSPLRQGSRERIIGVLVISVETTTLKEQEKALREAEADKKLLIHDLDHQVKNTIQSVISTLAREFEELPDQESNPRLARAIRRLTTLSLLYDTAVTGKHLSFTSLTEQLNQVVGQLTAGRNVSVLVSRRLEPISTNATAILPLCQLAGEFISTMIEELEHEEGRSTLLVSLERHGSDRGCFSVVACHRRPHALRASAFTGRLLEELSAELEVSEGPPETRIAVLFAL
ncbi:MAG: histidine kinase dimerization/phosphoacceptor domain -containing protein [Alkalispirochaetaceae bacterium]